jgi:acyl carrier protein
LKDKVIEIVSKAAKLDVSVLMKNPSELLWDSMTHLEIIFLLEEAFDVRLDVSDIAVMRSINAIIDVLQRILNSK